MKRLLLLFILLATAAQSQAQSLCPGGLLTNEDFTSGLTNWTQFGTITTATVLPTGTGCLNNFLTLQATNNSECGVEQPVVLKQDTCYELCYCYEFPQSGSLFNAKLVIAAITSGVTVNQVVTNTIPAGQGQILDFIASNTFIPPTSTCTAVFQATGNYTSIVIVNKTTGNIGTDVRVDNVCLTRHACPYNPCDSLDANFSYTPSGNTVNFTDLSTFAVGSTLSWSWDFGDPPSGVNNTSTLQNPSHTYPGPGAYFVCLYLSSVSSDGLTACQDTFCLDINVPGTVGIDEANSGSLVMSPNPADDNLQFKGTALAESITLYNNFGQLVFKNSVKNNNVTLPRTLSEGVYNAVIETDTGTLHRKLMIKR